MLKFDLEQTDKHSILILLRRKNLRFLRRTNLIKTRYHTFEMKIENRNKLKEWLDQNHWFEEGYISEINGNYDNLEITVGYQTSGTFIAGEPRELKEFTIRPIGLSSWTYKDQFVPSKDVCIDGIDLTKNGIGLKFETPSVFEMFCESIEISEPKIIKTYTNPWISNREFFATVKQMSVPKPSYWIEQYEKYGLKTGFRYFSSEQIQTDKIPFPNYSGYFIQLLNKINQTERGVFFKFIGIENGELRIEIEQQDETNKELFETAQSIISDWQNVLINSGNVTFTGKEWKEHKENGKYPERIEKIKNVW